MNSDTIKGDWKQFVGKAESAWGKLTGDHATVAQGDTKNLFGSFQSLYGTTREAFDKHVNEWNASAETKTTTTTTTTKTNAA